MIEFENSMSKIQRFIINYFKQFEILCIRSTRERNFLLHTESTVELIKYFFVPRSFELCVFANIVFDRYARYQGGLRYKPRCLY